MDLIGPLISLGIGVLLVAACGGFVAGGVLPHHREPQ